MVDAAMLRLIAIVLLVSLTACQSGDLAGRAVPIIDGQGRVVGTIPAGTMQGKGTPKKLDNTTSTTTAENSANIAGAPIDSAANAAATALLDGQAYMQAEYLESVGFNPQGKKKFFIMDDGLQKQTVEYVANVDLSKLAPPKPAQVSYGLASNYDVLPPDMVKALAQIECLSKKQLKDAKVVKSKQFSVWPLLPSNKNSQQITVLDVSRMQPHGFARLYSHAQSNRRPTYYWPMVIFMDNKGCAISASTQYYQGQTSTTMLKHSAIHGTILVPANTHYITLTPIKQLIDHPMLNLNKVGAIDWLTLP